MAIPQFFSKKDSSDNEETESYGPKTPPNRDAAGKFVSKSKKVKTKKVKKVKEKSKPKGPFPVPFGGQEIKRYYLDKTWYFNLKDLLLQGTAEPHFMPMSNLKKNEKIKEILDKRVVKIEGASCVTGGGGVEIIKKIINQYDASFPGQITRWLEKMSQLPFTISSSKPSETPTAPPPAAVNPSDRG